MHGMESIEFGWLLAGAGTRLVAAIQKFASVQHNRTNRYHANAHQSSQASIQQYMHTAACINTEKSLNTNEFYFPIQKVCSCVSLRVLFCRRKKGKDFPEVCVCACEWRVRGDFRMLKGNAWHLSLSTMYERLRALAQRSSTSASHTRAHSSAHSQTCATHTSVASARSCLSP